MRKPAVVLGPTGVQMVDQMLARLGIEALQIFVRKGAQQQLGLIQPAGVRRRIEGPQARLAGHVGLGVVGHVRRAVVQDQVQASGPGIVAGEPPQRPRKCAGSLASRQHLHIEPS